MKHGAASVFRLQLILMQKRFEYVIGMMHRQLCRVGVIRHLIARCDYVRITLFVVLGEAVGRAFCWSGFKIIDMRGFFLELDDQIDQ